MESLINQIEKLKDPEIRVFKGEIREEMHKAMSQCDGLLNIADVLDQRINSHNSKDENKINDWWFNYYTSGDCVSPNPSGKDVKIILDSEDLRRFNPESKTKTWYSSLDLRKGAYDSFPSQTDSGLQLLFSIDEFNNLTSTSAVLSESKTKKELLSNPLLISLARGKERLEKYIEIGERLIGKSKATMLKENFLNIRRWQPFRYNDSYHSPTSEVLRHISIGNIIYGSTIDVGSLEFCFSHDMFKKTYFAGFKKQK